MFTAQQQAIIATRQYSKAINFTFNLEGNVIKWTTLPFDYGDFQSENFIESVNSFSQSTNNSKTTASLGIIGDVSILSAFDRCEGKQVDIQFCIYSDINNIQVSNIFSGTVERYSIDRSFNKVTLSMDLTDSLGNLDMTNSRLLTPEDQKYRYANDDCLKYMADTKEAVFWGKEK